MSKDSETSKIIPLNSWWSDINETATIFAQFSNGRLIETNSGKEVLLPDGTPVRITVGTTFLDDQDYKLHTEVTTVTLLPKGTVLTFFIGVNESNKEMQVELEEDLRMFIKGNKLGRLYPVACVVYDETDTLKPIRVNSLNQAYSATSVRLRPNSPSHTCNVFKTFYYNDTPLNALRNEAETKM